ncbi:MAG: translation initiation factor IF-6 [Candidatus Hadarchaeia archaeon]
MNVARLNFSHIPYLGAFGLATDDLLLVPSRFGKIPPKVKEVLEVPTVETVISQSSLIGILSAGNKNGIIVPDHIDTDEKKLATETNAEVTRIPGKLTALGNQVLTNDNGAIINPDLSRDSAELIEEALGVPVRKSTIAGLKNVGASGVATNKGVLLHVEASEGEAEIVEDLLDVHVDIGTAAGGSKYVGTCVLANSNGALVGKTTTGPELGRIENALGFI